MYYHDTGQYALEREVLDVIFEFLGKNYDVSWNLIKLDNLLLDSDLQNAERVMDTMRQSFPGHYETWLGEGLAQKARGDIKASLKSFRKAADIRPAEFRPRLEMAVAHWSIADRGNALMELNAAKKRMINLRELKMIQKAVSS